MRRAVNPKTAVGSRKAPLRLVPPALEIYTSVVMSLGGAKYYPYNWRTLHVSHVCYLEAAKRHLLAALDGEDVDPESGVPHEAHVAACMAIVLDAMSIGRLTDDRHKTGKVPALLDMAAERSEAIRRRHRRIGPTHHGKVRR